MKEIKKTNIIYNNSMKEINKTNIIYNNSMKEINKTNIICNNSMKEISKTGIKYDCNKQGKGGGKQDFSIISEVDNLTVKIAP